MKPILIVPSRNRNAILCLIVAAAGLLAAVFVLRQPSETNAALLFGYSAFRLALAGGLLLAALLFGLAAGLTFSKSARWLTWMQALQDWFSRDGRLFWAIAPLTAALSAALIFFIAALSPINQTLILFSSLYSRLGVAVYWLALTCVCLLALLRLNFSRSAFEKLLNSLRMGIFFVVILAFLAVFLKMYTLQSGDYRFSGTPDYFVIPALISLLWAGAYVFLRRRPFYERWLSSLLNFLMLWSLAFIVFQVTAHLVNWQATPSKAYWNLLADAFLHGRLFLIDPPTTHDLTFFNGNWYVPNPPMPAVTLMPAVALMGVEAVNMVTVSAILAAFTVALVYFILREAAQRGVIPTSQKTNLWLTLVFALGTDFWWLAVMGQMWFVSQLLTLACAALAVWLTLRRASPWWGGLFLGLAILSRPNVFTLWPLLLGLELYFQHPHSHQLNWKAAWHWAWQSAVPVVLSVVVLLGYNQIRFGDWFDFGYVTINGADAIVAAVQQYGMFNLHFVPANLELMLLRLPHLVNEAGCWVIERTGFSMFLMTPALMYVFRRWRWNWWTIGAWTATLLSAGLLAFYHNNGSNQLGYRYLMDFILPVLLLMGLGVGKRPGWVFKLLTAAAVLGNFIGLLYWFRFACPVG